MTDSTSILFVDAHDSFAQNIVALLHQELNVNVTVIKIDTDIEKEFACSLQNFVERYAAVVLGPGPGDPRHGSIATGIFESIIQHATQNLIPILGICLGFQTLCISAGLVVQRLPFPCHGHAKEVTPVVTTSLAHLQARRNIFEGLENETVVATCYNSLGVFAGNDYFTPSSSRPSSSHTDTSFSSASSSRPHSDVPVASHTAKITILAVDQAGYAMSVVHNTLPFWGVQFHPESCKSNKACRQLVRNWFDAAERHNALDRPNADIHKVQCKKSMLAAADVDPCGTSSSYGAFASFSRPMPQSLDGTSRLERLPRMSGESLNEILSSAASTSGNVVQWTRLDGFCRQDVADLVHDLSLPDSTLMLESTKKGHFSIYPLLGPGIRAQIERSATLDYSFFSVRSRQENVTIHHQTNKSTASLNCHRLCSEDESAKATAVCQSYSGAMPRWQLIEAIHSFMTSKLAIGGPAEVPFWGGLVGYLSYEFGLDGIDIHDHNRKKDYKRTTDDLSLMWVERCLIHDARTSAVYVQTLRADDHGFIESMVKKLMAWQKTCRSGAEMDEFDARSKLQNALATGKILTPKNLEYDSAYEKCQSHLHAGDSYELCLTNRARIKLPELSPSLEYHLYKNMHAFNPVPYSAFLSLPEVSILSTSPEHFMSWSRTTGAIDMLPMKGTVKRSSDMTLAKATEILNTPKESAENLMIADLIRHDLFNAVGYTSQVEVLKLCEVVEHETVYQLVSHIRAHPPITLKATPDVRQAQIFKHGFKALTSSLPPGSMTGAPKKKSCEILQRLEDSDRGVYSGVLGYMDVGGGGSWNVCIRTAFRTKSRTKHADNEHATINAKNSIMLKKNTLTTEEHSMETGTESSDNNNDEWIIGAGGAITVLSSTDGEWDEMMVKMNSVLKAFREVAPTSTSRHVIS